MKTAIMSEPAYAEIPKSEYTVYFEDIFSHAKAQRTVRFTDKEYHQAIIAMNNKSIVYDRLVNGIHWQMRITEITEL